MNFDIKDIKSWSNRHDAKVGDKGYFFNDIDNAKNDDCYCKPVRGTVEYIRDNYCYCFGIDKRGLKENYSFFLPLEAVKEDKPKEKRYRPFKSMRELTEILYGADWEYGNLSVGDNLWIRRKGDEHVHQNLLIISLGYNENDLISMNDKPMQEWLDNFEFLAHCEWRPFGVEEND